MAKKKQISDDQLQLELEPKIEEQKEPEIQVIADETDAPIAEEPKTGSIPVDDGIRELKFQLEEERQARIAAEKRAQDAAARVNMAKTEVDDTNLKLLENAIATVSNNAAILKQQYKEALENANYEEAAEIQLKMSDVAVQKMQLEQGKNAYEARMKEPKPEPMQYQQDPVEVLASQLSPRSAKWVREHPEYARNPNLYQKMLAAHNLAMADGLQADTDDYFDSIETTLKINRGAATESDSALSSASSPAQRRSSPPAAPVSRAPANNAGNRPNVVRLSAQEREMAEMMGMTDQEYAKNKMALIKEGKLN